ncbi:MAG: type 3 dihydrofolate reductase [Arenicellales bacterium]|nr:type 3 dihydrofolate reductase [Arenicellales bacterium]
MSEPRLSIIVAMDLNGLIGKDNQLPWYLPADLKHFKQITMGKPVIMGRKTFESIGKPLPGRVNIVLTRRTMAQNAGCIVVNSLDAAIKAAGPVSEVMIIGGAALYGEALPRADRIYLTQVQAELEGDTWFPSLDESDWVVMQQAEQNADENNPYGYVFKTLDRI